MVTQKPWKFGCALASALCMVLLSSCFLITAVIQRRAVAPPDINLVLGNTHLVAYVTKRPNCPPYGGRKPSISVPCSTDSLFASEEAYTVWLLISGRSSPSGSPRTTFRRLVLLPIE
jgi:hypothetical protein